MGFDTFEDGSYPTYYCLMPKEILGERETATVNNCTIKVLGITESGTENIVFGYVEKLEFGS